MPDFTIDGDPGAIQSRCATMRSKGTSFHDVADSLTKIKTDGWKGRAADKFRDKFDTQPDKWRQAGDGFIKAAGALEGYADALQTAQERAKQAAADYARGEQATHDAKNEYDASVSNARNKVAAARAAGQLMQLIIEPFHDPGAAIRQQAIDNFNSAKSDLDNAAHACAAEVDASHAGAPDTTDFWHKSGLHAIGEVGKGIGEAVMELAKLAELPFKPLVDLSKLLTGDLTLEEFSAQQKMKLEDAEMLVKSILHDPGGFFKTLGESLIDLNTWKDNPAEAFGKLVPTIIMTAVTLGSGSLASGAAKGAEAATTATEDALSASEKADEAVVAAKQAASDGGYATPEILDAQNGAMAKASDAYQKLHDAREAEAMATQKAEMREKIHDILEKAHYTELGGDLEARKLEGYKEFGEEAEREHTIHTLSEK